MQLTHLFIHPLKSARGIAYSRAFASKQGLLHDREWLLIDSTGNALTARAYPKMLLIEMDLLPGAMVFRFPGRAPIFASPTQFHSQVDVQVWKDAFTAYYGESRLDNWFSEGLGTECRLVWLGARSARRQKNSTEALSFADGYPYLLVNQASIDELNESLTEPVGVRHFRPNLVINGPLAYEEDQWKRVRIGQVDFAVAKPCTRCILTTMDPQTGSPRSDGEPLKTLIRTRRKPEGVCFGLNVIALNEGIINQGDSFEVLETEDIFK